MRMLPSAPHRSLKSDAERRIFRLLAATEGSGGAVAYHSLNISRHDYKIVGELDFVILTSRYVLVLEVKGGRVACSDGVWTFTDRFGDIHRRSEGPFEQARSGMFSLRRRVEERFGRSVVDKLAWGYAVAMPDTEFPVVGVEWDDDMLIDAASIRGRSDLTESLERLTSYWVAKHHLVGSPLSKSAAAEIGSFLRPDFDRVPSLRNRADDLDAAMEELTQEQYARLDLIEENPRILCGGGAGTGKTFIAAEVARREAAQGRSVLFVTSTQVLAAFLAQRLPPVSVEVCAMRDLPEGLFEVLVVDEAQDLMNIDDLARLDVALAGGLGSGRWRMFYDHNRQTGLSGRFEPEVLDLLRSYGGVSATLTRNCRNTHQVVLQTKLLTGGDLGTASAGEGPPVAFAPFETQQEQVDLIGEQLSRLRDDGVPSGEVTILSPLAYSDSAASRCRVARKGRLHEVSPSSVATWPPNGTTFSTISNFKGLENRFVLLVDIERVDTVESINALYVAMSRARTGLWIAVRRDIESELSRISESNLAAVLEEATHVHR